jgi:hypothetical protein
VFHEIVDAFTRVAALAHNWSFPIKFPFYLLLDLFIASVQHDSIVVDGYEGFQFTDNEVHRIISAPGAKTSAIAVDGADEMVVIDQRNPRNVFVVGLGAPTRINTNIVQVRIPKHLEKFCITLHFVDLSP